ncbi:Putative cell wall binding repeat-containing protein [Lachnospiraceae bacterium NE2001]|nr:Putative cell wall binding repeat-containing protein [Lachnospiraceae bacterium NE2001]
MGKRLRRFLSIFLSIAMVLGYTPCTGITAYAAGPTVVWNDSDINGSGQNPFTKDGITITAGTYDYSYKNFLEGGTFTTTRGNFTKIEFDAKTPNVSGTGWSTSEYHATWQGTPSSSVPFEGSIWDCSHIEFTIAAATPTFSPVGGEFTEAQTVTISCDTADATIYYTTDGTDPTTSSSVYSSAIAVDATTTIKAIAVKEGVENSAVAEATYTIKPPAVATPTFSPVEGTYTSVQSVEIDCATDGAIIYYTTDGSDPTISSSVYSAAISVDETKTIKAIAVKEGMSDSAVAEATYTINIPVVETPTFSPAAGTYTKTQTVTISCATEDAKIYYTTDGTAPTASSAVYTEPITVDQNTTIKAIAVKDEMTDSEVATAEYVINVPATIIKAPTANNRTYDGDEKALVTAGIVEHGTMYYRVDGGEWTTTVPTAKDAGTYKVEWYLKGYESGSSAETPAGEAEVTIQQKTASLGWTGISHTYDGKPYSPTAKVTNKVSDDDISVKVESTGLNAGEYIATAIGLVGDDENNYKLSDAVNQTFVINKAPLKVIADNKSVDYGADAPDYTVTYNGFVDEEDASRLGGTLEIACSYNPTSAAGTYDIVPSGLTSDNYDITFVKGTLTVGAKVATITTKPTANTLEYNGESQALVTPGEAANGTIYYSVNGDEWGDEIPFESHVGTYNVKWYVVPKAGFTSESTPDIPAGETDVVIQQKTVKLAWSGISFKYDGTAHCPTVNINNKIDGDKVEAKVTGTGTNAGEYIAEVEQLTGNDSENYKLPDTVTQTFVISKASLTVTADDVELDYGSPLPDPAPYSATPSGLKGDDKITDLVGTLVFECDYSETTLPGTYDIVPSGLTSDNYDITYVNGTLTVKAGTAKITVDPKLSQWATYDSTYKTLVEEGKASNGTIYYSVNGDAWSEDAPTARNAGIYRVAWYLEPDVGYTSDSSKTEPAGEFTTAILKKSLKAKWELNGIKWPDDGKKLVTPYNGEEQCPTVSFDGWTETDEKIMEALLDVTISGAATAVGDHTATVTNLSLNLGQISGLVNDPTLNYVITEEKSVDFTIEKATIPDDEVSVTLDPDYWTYGDAPVIPEVEGNIEGANVTYKYKAKGAEDSEYETKVPVNVGEYTIQATIAATAGYNEKTATADFEIIQRLVGITWSETSFEYTGEAQAPEAELTNLVYGDTVELVYKYKKENAPEGEYLEGKPIDAGKYIAEVGFEKVDAEDKNGDNYILPEDISISFEITQNSPDLEIGIDGWRYGEYDEEANAPKVNTNTSGEVVTFVYYTDEDCTVKTTKDNSGASEDGGVPVFAGDYTVKATIKETGNYKEVNATANFTIEKAELTVTANNETITYGDKQPDFSVKYEGFKLEDKASDLDGELAIDCDCEGALLAGSYDIIPSGLESKNYRIEFINGTLTVDQKTATLSWTLNGTPNDTETKLVTVYNAADQCPEATVTNLEEADKDKVSVKVIGAATAAGKHTAEAVELTGEAAAKYCLPEDTQVEFTIKTSDENTATLTMAGWTYGDDPQDPVIENNIGGGTVTYSYKQIKDAEGNDLETEAEFKTAKPSAAGTYTVKAVIAATESYNSKELTAEFTIEQRTAELEWGETSFVYDGESHIPTCVVANLKNSDRCTVDLIALDSKDADDKTGTDGKTTAREDAYYAKAIGLSGAEAANYKLPTTVTTTFSISKDEPKISVNITGWTYGDKPHKPTIEGNKEKAEITYIYYRFVDGDPKMTDATNSGASEEGGVPVFAGDYRVSAYIAPTINYSGDVDHAEFTIEQKTLSLEWTGTSLIYSGEEQAPTATPANLEEGDECTVTVSGAEIKIGEYVATATALEGKDAANYKLPETVTQTFIITKKDVDITVSMKDWTYGATASEPEITVTPDNAGTTVVEYKAISAKDSDYSDEKPTAAGTYTVRVTVAADDNYKVNTATDNFTISPKEVSLKWTLGEGTWPNDDEKMLETIYNAEDQCPTVEVEGIVEGDEVEAKVVGATTAVGTHTAEVVKLTGAAAANYVLPEDSSVKFKIVKQDLADAVIILDDWTYGDSPNVPVVEGNAEGAYITFMYKAAEAEDTAYTSTVPTLAGAYKVKAIISATAGYNGKTIEKEFNINKAPINPELTIADWIYGDTASTPVLTGNIENGEVTYTYYVDETCETPTDEANGGAAAEGEVPVNVGAYTLKAEVATTDNYLAGETTAAFNIGQRTLAITAENKSKTYGLDDPALTYTQTGLVDGDEITGDLVRAEGENVGDYAITQGTVTANDNYTIEFTNGTFTITEAASVVTKAPKAKDLTYSGSAYELVDAGTAANGTMMYALGSASTAPAETAFSTAIPKATDTNVYYVWYMVKGDENYGDVAPACVKAEIKEVDKTELNKAISDAEALLKTLEANDDYKDVADELSKAIEDAKKVAADKNATASTVANAATSMNGAEEKAEADKTAVDKYNFGDSKITGKASADAMAKSDDSAASKKLITDAKTAIDNLAYDESKTPEQNQARIDEILNKLSSDLEAQRAAEKKAAEEAEEAANQKAADEVAKLINALPAPKDISANDKAAIEAARNAYNALTEEQKLKVDETTLNKLLDAEAALARAIQYSGEWVDGQWYNADGSATYAPKGQWKSDSKGKWYEDTSGWYPTATWQKIDGKWYYFTADGYMDYSEYRDGYWLGSDGAWVEKYYGGRWYEDSTGYWYQDSTGWYPRNQWLWINGKCYYFDGSGYMLKSQYVGGYWVGPDGSWQ